MNKSKISLSCILLVFCLGLIIGIRFLIYLSATYNITPENSQFKNSILNRINRNEKNTPDFEIKQELTLDNKKYVFITFERHEGSAEFTKGINKKYKLDEVSYGTSEFRSELIKTNKGKYMIIFCKNQNNEIEYAKVYLEDQEYKIDIPQEDYVIAYCKAPNSSHVGFIDVRNIKFYGNNNIDVTQDVLLYQ